jgi:hypothetical protein
MMNLYNQPGDISQISLLSGQCLQYNAKSKISKVQINGILTSSLRFRALDQKEIGHI